MSQELVEARRPLKSRSTWWAKQLAGRLHRFGLTPNQVSLLSMGCAAVGGAGLLLYAVFDSAVFRIAALLIAILGIQSRLLCNLLDGMLAIECGLKSKSGEIYNEIPDRISDIVIFICAGLACGEASYLILSGVTLGMLAAIGSLFTAYVRMTGAACGTPHFFTGPMAKQQRMAALSAACLIQIILVFRGSALNIFPVSLAIMILGILWTAWRRLKLIVSFLEQR